MPKPGQMITVDLPDERTRAEVVKVISDTACLARISQFTTAAKSHPYHKGDVVAVQHRRDGMGQQAWIAIDERPTAPSLETIASLAEADGEEKETADAVDAGKLQVPPQPQPKRTAGKKGSGPGKRHAEARRA